VAGDPVVAFDLVIRGATVVTPGHAEAADIGIAGGRIARLGGTMAIAVGSDADIALWDPGRRRTIDGARMQSLSGYSVYDGWQVQGWPAFVLRRGALVLADGELTARPGTGEWLPRAARPGH